MQETSNVEMGSARQFRVMLVEKTSVPHGGAEDDTWYRYVLSSGCSAITGWRRGSLQEVTQHATRCTEELNARSRGGTSSWSPRRKKVGSSAG